MEAQTEQSVMVRWAMEEGRRLRVLVLALALALERNGNSDGRSHLIVVPEPEPIRVPMGELRTEPTSRCGRGGWPSGSLQVEVGNISVDMEDERCTHVKRSCIFSSSATVQSGKRSAWTREEDSSTDVCSAAKLK